MHEINMDSFSHGQILSKIWLCEELEKHIEPNCNINILGGWYNVLGFMLNVRRPNYYSLIRNIDQDHDAIIIADKIMDYYKIESKVENICLDANSFIPYSSEVYINCSVEHFESNDWYEKLYSGTLVCIQSSNMLNPNYPWLIKSPNPDIETLIERFPMSSIKFAGTKDIIYSPTNGYSRYMIIGIK